MSLEEYNKLLESHNWDWNNSTDPIIYETWLNNHNYLIKLASINPDFRSAFFERKRIWQQEGKNGVFLQ